MTGEEAAAKGYRRVSNAYRQVARIDRPDWVAFMAGQLRRAPADFYIPGAPQPTGNWCDFYRRSYSKDVYEFPLDQVQEFRKVPTSCGNDTGYIPNPEVLTMPKKKTTVTPKNPYDALIDDLVEVQLERLCEVKAPATEYLAALKRAHSRIDNWFEASIDAAKGDVRRQEEDE